MITRISAESPESPAGDTTETKTSRIVLARYGSVPIVARFDPGELTVDRGQQVVVETDRGRELATVLEDIPQHLQKPDQTPGKILRLAVPDDLARATDLSRKAEQQYADWLQRCTDWKLQLELIDVEWTLDEQLLLYVLNDRGPETTRLALLAAAGGHGIIHVQPVGPEGTVMPESSGGSCGSGGCGCSS